MYIKNLQHVRQIAAATFLMYVRDRFNTLGVHRYEADVTSAASFLMYVRDRFKTLGVRRCEAYNTSCTLFWNIFDNKAERRISKRTCAYQGGKKCSLFGNLACFVFLKHPFWDSPFSLITDDMYVSTVSLYKYLHVNDKLVRLK